jgi:hypothetical protein
MIYSTMGRIPATLQREVLVKAAQIVGGVEGLARTLGMSAFMLKLVIEGGRPVSGAIFAHASEILTDAGVADASKPSSDAGLFARLSE